MTTWQESSAVRDAVDKLANALEILAERTRHEIGDNDARAVIHLAEQARKAVGLDA